MTPNVLIVEDDPVAAESLRMYLEQEGWQVAILSTPDKVVSTAVEESIDLVFLDIRLPGSDGFFLCRELRAQSCVGVIITTSLTDRVETVVGYENGADAFFSKPLPMREMIACSKNILRRVQELRKLRCKQTETGNIYQFPSWFFSSCASTLQSDDIEVSLTRNENLVLSALVSNPGQVQDRTRLLKALGNREWRYNDRTIDVLVGKLRKKIYEVSSQDEVLVTRYGGGYVFNLVPKVTSA